MKLFVGLAVFYILTSSASANGINCTYMVSANGTCSDNKTCDTFNAYAKNMSWFQSNTIFCFLPGNHTMTIGNLRVDGISDISFVGLGTFVQLSIHDKVDDFNFTTPLDDDRNITFLEPTTIIQCENSSGFVFNNIANLSIINLAIVNCGSNVTGTLSPIQDIRTIDGINLINYVAVLMINVSNLQIEGTSIQNSTGYGLMGINILGQSQITGSSFVGNNQFVKSKLLLYTPPYCSRSVNTTPKFYVNRPSNKLYVGGNVIIIYSQLLSSYSMQPTLMDISFSLFALGVDGSLVNKSYGPTPFDTNFLFGTGLSVLSSQDSYNFHITVTNSVTYRNQGSYGNLNFHVKSTSADITLSNIRSTRGIGLFGGSMYVVVNPFQDIYNQHLFMITNSTFSSDYGSMGILNQQEANVSLKIENCSILDSIFIESESSNSLNIVVLVTTFGNTFLCDSNIYVKYVEIKISGCSFNNTNIHAFQSNLTIADVSFLLGALDLEYSNLSLTGNISFINNNNNDTFNGGALILYNSFATLYAPVSAQFINNTSYRGGAIYIYSSGSYHYTCYIQLNDPNGTLENPGIHLYFEGNYASDAGNVLYGGNMDSCKYDCKKTPNYYFCMQPNNVTSSYLMYLIQAGIVNITNNGNLSYALSSDPIMLCSCLNTSIECGNLQAGQTVYPGQTILIPIIAVDQLSRPSPSGIVYYICDVEETSSCTTPSMITYTTERYCTNFTLLVKAEKNQNVTSIIYLLPDTSVINYPLSTTFLTVLPCPFGFTLKNSTCMCCDVLTTCDIATLTVSRNITQWIGKSSNGALAVHPHCPYDYCNTDVKTFSLNNQDDQCANNHSGVLCGGCQPGLSAVFGSTLCKNCTDQNLWFLVLFSIMGVALVAFLLFLNCTVSVGTLNGLILYANIIRPGIINLLPVNNRRGYEKFLTVFIDWLNLDLGIEACFYNGMSTYAKAWLQFLFPLYILALVGAIIFGSRWSSKLAWLCKRNAVSVLATLILLSYTKIFITVVTGFSYTLLDIGMSVCLANGSNVNSIVDNRPVWQADGNVLYFHGKHVYLFIVGLIIAIVFILPYILLLLLSPWLQAKSHWKVFQWVNKLKPFIDAYQAPFKDQYRYWPGVHLMIRAVLYLVFTTNQANDINVNLLATTLVLIFYSVLANPVSVYKNLFLGLLESFYTINMMFLSASMLYIQDLNKSMTLVTVSIASGLFVSLLIMAYHIYKYVILRHKRIKSNNSVRHTETTPINAENMPHMYNASDFREPLMDDD